MACRPVAHKCWTADRRTSSIVASMIDYTGKHCCSLSFKNLPQLETRGRILDE